MIVINSYNFFILRIRSENNTTLYVIIVYTICILLKNKDLTFSDVLKNLHKGL